MLTKNLEFGMICCGRDFYTWIPLKESGLKMASTLFTIIPYYSKIFPINYSWYVI